MQPFLHKNIILAKYKYDFFLHKRPECRLMTMDNVISIMLKEGIINETEAKSIKNTIILPSLTQNDEDQDNFLVDTFNMNYYQSEPVGTIHTLKQLLHHKTFKDLIIKTNGQIDMGQFDINNIKQRFPADKYNLRIRDGEILVFDKNSNKVVFNIHFSKDNPQNFTCRFLYKNNIEKNYILENGKVIFYGIYSKSTQKRTYYNKEGQIKEITYTYENGMHKSISYDNGYPFEDQNRGINILAEDLHNDINAKNKLGLPTTRKSINKNILKRITKDNVYRVLTAYRKQYGEDLLDNLENEFGLKKEVKENLINHIKNAMLKSETQDEDTGRYIAEILAKDIYGIGSGNLKQDIKLINKYNVGIVAKKYFEIAIEKNIEAGKTLKPFNILFTNIYIYPNNLIAPVEGLVEALDMEFGLDEEVTNSFIKHITDCAQQSGFKTEELSFYTKDIKQDIASHPDDKEKLEVDLLRLGNRTVVSNKERCSKPNGKIDSSFKQGGIGDCWLIAGIISIIETAGGKQELEKLLEYDEKTGDITVLLKGVNRKYKITTKEIQENDQLSFGDSDIRAIEIAMDRFLKEEAYKNKKGAVDIDGNHASTAFQILLGNGKLIGYNDLKNKNFNNKNYVYTLGSLQANGQITGETVSGNKIELLEHHAYAIIKSDKDYVYVKNPHNFTNFSKAELNEEPNQEGIVAQKKQPVIIKILKSDLEKTNPAICIAKIR